MRSGSACTKRVVGGLQNDVTIVRFDKTADPALDDLMAEYKNLSPHLKFQNVDPQKKPEVAKEYGATRMKEVIIASGNCARTRTRQIFTRRTRNGS